MSCQFCGARRLTSGQFNCETELHPNGTWTRGWLCMWHTRQQDDDFNEHARPDLRNYHRPSYASKPQMDLF